MRITISTDDYIYELENGYIQHLSKSYYVNKKGERVTEWTYGEQFDCMNINRVEACCNQLIKCVIDDAIDAIENFGRICK